MYVYKIPNIAVYAYGYISNLETVFELSTLCNVDLGKI